MTADRTPLTPEQLLENLVLALSARDEAERQIRIALADAVHWRNAGKEERMASRLPSRGEDLRRATDLTANVGAR